VVENVSVSRKKQTDTQIRYITSTKTEKRMPKQNP
jgi:hypothetical protein